MGKVKFTAAIAEIRNKLGGSVYARNRYGAFARNYAIPFNPDTVYQQDMRLLFGAVSSYWKVITEDEREQWRSSAFQLLRKDIFGNQSPLTGAQLFNKINIEYMLVNDVLTTTPPVVRGIPLFTDLELSLDILNLEFFINLGFSQLTNEFAIVIRATSAQSQGATFFKNLYTIIKIVDDATTLPANIFVEYTTKYLGFTSGTRVGVQVYAVDKTSGWKSSPINGYIDVA